jgi:hypothetical protein
MATMPRLAFETAGKSRPPQDRVSTAGQVQKSRFDPTDCSASSDTAGCQPARDQGAHAGLGGNVYLHLPGQGVPRRHHRLVVGVHAACALPRDANFSRGARAIV